MLFFLFYYKIAQEHPSNKYADISDVQIKSLINEVNGLFE
jgi:hypothetical protein